MSRHEILITDTCSFRLPPGVPPKLAKLLRGCLCAESSKRWNMEAVKSCEWLKETPATGSDTGVYSVHPSTFTRENSTVPEENIVEDVARFLDCDR